MRSIVDGRIISMELEDGYSNPGEKGKEPAPTPPTSPDIRSPPSEGEEEESTLPYSPFYSPPSPPTTTIGDYLRRSGISGSKWYLDEGQFTLEIKTLEVDPKDAMEYFKPIFLTVGMKGNYVLKDRREYGEYISFGFSGWCPIHKRDHLGDYNDFCYTIRRGKYGGFKCWKDNSWLTTYKFEDLPLLAPTDPHHDV